MENYSYIGSKIGTFWFIICIFLQISFAKTENKTDPTANLNLAVFEGWRSALFCLRNISDACPEKYVLDESGWLNVTHSDGEEFCTKGCADHTRAVLTCIHHVKRDFWFANKAKVKHLVDTIDNGCNTPRGFTGISLYPSK